MRAIWSRSTIPSRKCRPARWLTRFTAARDEALIDIGGHITVAQDVEIYNQALVDARRMILDPEYARLFTG